MCAGAVSLPEDRPQGYDIELRDVRFGYRPDQPILQARPARMLAALGKPGPHCGPRSRRKGRAH